MKLVDVLDSKSCVGNHVPVRVRPSANKKNSFMEFFLFVQTKTSKHRALYKVQTQYDWKQKVVVAELAHSQNL